MGWPGKHDRTRRAKLSEAEAEAARDVLQEIIDGERTYAGKRYEQAARLLFDTCPATLHKAIVPLEVSYLTVHAIRKGLRRVDRSPPRVTP
jgi:hypothetical protein